VCAPALTETESLITWQWYHALINLVGWLLLFGVLLLFASYSDIDGYNYNDIDDPPSSVRAPATLIVKSNRAPLLLFHTFSLIHQRARLTMAESPLCLHGAITEEPFTTERRASPLSSHEIPLHRLISLLPDASTSLAVRSCNNRLAPSKVTMAFSIR
jgi:hypothetical protein